MKIECTTAFKHGRDMFEAGDRRTHADGEYFVKNGWAVSLQGDVAPGAPAPADTTVIARGTNHTTKESKHG